MCLKYQLTSLVNEFYISPKHKNSKNVLSVGKSRKNFVHSPIYLLYILPNTYEYIAGFPCLFHHKDSLSIALSVDLVNRRVKNHIPIVY